MTVARRSMSQKWENRETSDDCRHQFWQIIWSADDFFVEAPKLKVSLTDPPICMGFVIGEASGNGRPMIGWQSADFLKIVSSWYRLKVARSSGVNRPMIGRRSLDDILSKNRRQTDAGYRPSFCRCSPDCRLVINFGLCYIVFKMHVSTLNMKYIMHLFYFGIHLIWPHVQVISIFCNGFPVELIERHFEINISTTSKRLQPNSGHSLIYDDCNLILNIL